MCACWLLGPARGVCGVFLVCAENLGFVCARMCTKVEDITLGFQRTEG